MARKRQESSTSPERPSLAVERVALNSLHADPSNVNTHPDENIADLMAKLATFGQVEPLVVQRSTSKVIGGNGRLEAMRKLGWDSCDVAFVDCDNVTATALGIALNTRRSSLDEERLAAQLRALQSQSFDLASVGVTERELDELIEKLAEETAALAPSDDLEPASGLKTLSFSLEPDAHEFVVETLDVVRAEKSCTPAEALLYVVRGYKGKRP